MTKLYSKICKNPECGKHFQTKYATKEYCDNRCSYRSWTKKNRPNHNETKKIIKTNTGLEVKNNILGRTMVRKKSSLTTNNENFLIDS
jgi:hypothetical protein